MSSSCQHYLRILYSPVLIQNLQSSQEFADFLRVFEYGVSCLFLGAAIQTMECLKLYEHMATVMAEAMAVFAREFSSSKTTQDVLR